MKQLGKIWQYIILLSVLAIYLYLNVYKQMSVAKAVPYYLIILLVTGMVFIGNIVGNLTIMLYSIIKSDRLAMFSLKICMKLGAYAPTVLNSYGFILLRNGEYEQSYAVLKKAEASATYYLLVKSITVNKALCLWKMNQIEEAIHLYEQLVRNYQVDSPETDVMTILLRKECRIFNSNDYVSLSYLYLLANQMEQSEQLSLLCLELYPTVASAYDNLGQMYYRKNDFDLAKLNFEKALALKSTLADSLYYMSLIHLTENNIDQALHYLNQLLPLPINGLSSISKNEILQLQKQIETKGALYGKITQA